MCPHVRRYCAEMPQKQTAGGLAQRVPCKRHIPMTQGVHTSEAFAGRTFAGPAFARSAHAAILVNDDEPTYPALPQNALLYIHGTFLLGVTVLFLSLANWSTEDLLKFAGFLMVALFSSGMRISVPGAAG